MADVKEWGRSLVENKRMVVLRKYARLGLVQDFFDGEERQYVSPEPDARPIAAPVILLDSGDTFLVPESYERDVLVLDDVEAELASYAASGLKIWFGGVSEFGQKKDITFERGMKISLAMLETTTQRIRTQAQTEGVFDAGS